jgi:hypothetical protein
MPYTLLTGLLGSLILVTGAAWPESGKTTNPRKSIKDWLFFIGGIVMTGYAILGFLEGGSVFFIILQTMVVISGILMMLDLDDRIDMAILGVSGLGLIIYSLSLFQGLNTVLFILGLCAVGLGYAFKTGTLRRSAALTVGSLLIVLFSYLEASWIFFWLNLFFAAFSGYYLIKGIGQKKKHPGKTT